jgi:hypothetical protein
MPFTLTALGRFTAWGRCSRPALIARSTPRAEARVHLLKAVALPLALGVVAGLGPQQVPLRRSWRVLR